MKKIITLLIFVTTFVCLGGVANAEVLPLNLDYLTGEALPVEQPEPKPEVKKVKKQRTHKAYTVRSGDNLISISKRFKTSWERLYFKNKGIKHPDFIKIGQKLVIPFKNEKLKKRKIPATSLLPRASYSPSIGSSAGNGYDYHQCTWHVKEMRPDIPNDWHNATDWLYNARADGYATGSTPRAGAIGWTYGHVVYIIKVKGDQVYLSERNYDYRGSYRERWASASAFTYIY